MLLHLQRATTRRAAPALALRALSSQRRRLPTVEDIRRYSPAELEHARVDLADALDLIGHAKVTEARRGELLRLLATTHLRLGASLDAEHCLDEALDIEDRNLAMTSEPEDGGAARCDTTFLLGVCYQKSGRLDRAERKFNEVLASDDDHWRSRFHLALLRIKGSDFEEAEELLLRVHELSPDHEKTIELLAKLKERSDAEQLKLAPPP